MVSKFLVVAAVCQSFALRPQLSRRASPDDASKEACPQYLTPPAPSATAPACFLKKGGYNDGVGHQLFGTLSVMGAHGVLGEMGHCYVYSAPPRNFSFAHLHPGTQAWNESDYLMSALYHDFRSQLNPSGCATAELVARSPTKSVPMCQNYLHLGEIPCHENSVWEMDNVWYGYSDEDLKQKQLVNYTPFMRAVIRNATRLAVMVAGHLPTPDEKPSLAAHMRFGDRRGMLKPVTQGQHEFFMHSGLAGLSPMHVFTDTVDMAESNLEGTGFAGASIYGPNNGTVIQAMAQMVAADVFVGSRSDVSSSAALMRIGLGKKRTFMPSGWAWAKAFSDEELTLYPEVKD